MHRIPRDLVRHLEWAPGSAQPPAIVPPSAPVLSPGAFNVYKHHDDRYIISPVLYRGELYQVSLGADLLDGGKKHTQDQWVDALQGTEWRLPSAPLMLGLLSTLYSVRDGTDASLVAEVQEKLKKDFKDLWMMTGTRIKYATNGLDTVLHEYRSPEEYSLEAPILGPDGWVTPSCEYGPSIDALLETTDLAALESVSEWASGKKPYLWRVNNTPSSEVQRALVLGVVSSDGFFIDANYSIDGSRPARGVAVQKISGSPTGVPR